MKEKGRPLQEGSSVRYVASYHGPEPKIIRYVITHQANGIRQLTLAMQGRDTFGTAEEAQAFLDANNGFFRKEIVKVIGAVAAGTLAVRPVECWSHFDPKTMWFEWSLGWLECFMTTVAGLPGKKG